MPSFLPRIPNHKSNGEEVAGRPKTKRLRFGDHHGNNRVALPSVGSSPANGQHLRYFNSRQVVQKITDWYETWQPWQRKLLLCGITARCSTNQLELLATAMEPVFHRDFMTTLRGRYPSLSYSKHRKAREGSQHVRKRTGASGVALNDAAPGSPVIGNVATTVDVTNGDLDGPSTEENIQVSKVGKVTVDISKDITPVEVPTVSKHTHDKRSEDHTVAEKPSISAEDASIIRKLSKQMQAHEINEARTDTPGSKISSHRSGTLSPIGESSPETEEEEEQALGAEEPLHTPVPSPNTALSLGVLTPIQETNSEVSSVSTIQEQPELAELSERGTPQAVVDVVEDGENIGETQEAVQVTITEAVGVAGIDADQKETANEGMEQAVAQAVVPAVEDGKAVVQAVEGENAVVPVVEGTEATSKATVQAMEVEVEKQPTLDQEMMLQFMLDARSTPQKEGEEVTRNGHADGEVVRPKSDTTASRTRKSRGQSRSGSVESSHSAGSVPREHKHRSNISSGSCRTVDFFSRQRTDRLGSVRLQVSQGAPGWLDAEEVGGYAPLQQMYKYGRLWGASPEGRRLVPASSHLLQKNFMEQLNQIWQVLSDWEDHQKAEVLVEMIKGSNDGEVSFFAQCLLQRLKDQLDINCLPDHLLLRILGMLRASDLGRAAQVCRRWQYLVAQDALWIRKCRELGSREALPDIIGMVQMASLGDSVDWKQAYLELVFIANQARDMHAESDEDWEAELQELEYNLSRKERRSRHDRRSRRGTFSSSRMEEGKYSLASHIEDLQARLSSTILEDSQEVSGSRSAALTPSVLTTGLSRSASRLTSRVHLEDRSTVMAPDKESLETEVVCKPLRRQLQGRRKSHDPGDAAMDIRHELKQPPEKLLSIGSKKKKMAAGSEWSKHHSRMPRFNMKEKTYEQYRFELECWNAVTTLGKTRRGIEIMLSLPEGKGEDEYNTREFLSSRLSMPELTSETSFDNVLAKLDEHLRVDKTGRLWDSFAAFDQFSRGSLTMSEYISKFDVLYNTLNKCGKVTLPASVLGLLLVRRANLTPDESKLVMTGLDYTKETALYTQAKASLRKFSSELMSAHSSNSFAMPMMKHEVHVAERQAFQSSRGRYVPGATGQYKPGRYNKPGRGRGGFRFQDGGHGSKQGQGEGTLNPRDKYGDYLRCRYCGSFRHFLEDCPDAKAEEAYVTEAEVKLEEDEKFTVLFTHAASESKYMMSKESTEPYAVLDSACSSTVCGSAWMDQYLSGLDKKDIMNVSREASSHVFEFGGDNTLPSLGRYRIPANLAGRDVLITTDVVERDIPLLLSLDAMKKAGVVLNTQEDRATIFGRNVDLRLTTSGHYCVSLVDRPIRVKEVFKANLGKDMRERRTQDSVQVQQKAQMKSLQADLKIAQVKIADLIERNDTLAKTNQEIELLSKKTEDEISQLHMLTEQLRYENSSIRETLAAENTKSQMLQENLKYVMHNTERRLQEISDSMTKKYQNAVGHLTTQEGSLEAKTLIMIETPETVEDERQEPKTGKGQAAAEQAEISDPEPVKTEEIDVKIDTVRHGEETVTEKFDEEPANNEESTNKDIAVRFEAVKAEELFGRCAFPCEKSERETDMGREVPQETETVEKWLSRQGKFMSVAGLPVSDQSSTVSMTETHSSIVGAVHAVRKVRKLQGHMDSVQCLALDKRRLMTGSMDRTVRVWDIRSGRSIRKLYGHKMRTSSQPRENPSSDTRCLSAAHIVHTWLTFADLVGGIRSIHFNQTKICTGSWDMSIMVWDIVQFERLAVLTGHRGAVSCLQCNQHFLGECWERKARVGGQVHPRYHVAGVLMFVRAPPPPPLPPAEGLLTDRGIGLPLRGQEVSGSHDSTMIVWSLDSFEWLNVIEAHAQAVTCLQLIGRCVISGSMDMTLRLSDIHTSECLQQYHGHQAPVLCLTVSHTKYS
ncbi:FBXW7 [Branchiostoma lanceolatum]|uniref:FBXW7 protein n=1 Tax=Branchiostoma lanceolatum TaxID=7740 RepID=A0A8K0EPX9_BRALA|nr:FBXW7 [Branchiostoma lanceolatum]